MTTDDDDSSFDDEAADDWFEPREKDAADLRWYFKRGPDGNRDGSPEVRKRWRKIDRWLDGGGFYLMLHYTGQGAPEQHLVADYRRYFRNTQQKGWGAEDGEAHRVVTLKAMRALLRRARPFHEIVERDVWRSEETALEQRERDPVSELDRLLANIPSSTWGDLRVDEVSAKAVLEMVCGVKYVDAKMMDARAAIALLEEKIKAESAPVPWDWLSGDEREEARLKALREDPDPDSQRPPTRKSELLDELEAIADAREQIRALDGGDFRSGAYSAEFRDRTWVHKMKESYRVTGQSLAPGTWDPRKIETNNGRETTTVSELAERVAGRPGLGNRERKLGSKWVRKTLTALQCPGVGPKSSAIPIAWLSSDKGREFWKRAEAEQDRRVLRKLT